MSLPYVQIDTHDVLEDREERIAEGRKASKVEVAAELLALAASRRLKRMNVTRVAKSFGWSVARLQRFVADREWHGLDVLADRLPCWWGAVPGTARLDGRAYKRRDDAVSVPRQCRDDAETQTRDEQGIVEERRDNAETVPRERRDPSCARALWETREGECERESEGQRLSKISGESEKEPQIVNGLTSRATLDDSPSPPDAEPPPAPEAPPSAGSLSLTDESSSADLSSSALTYRDRRGVERCQGCAAKAGTAHSDDCVHLPTPPAPEVASDPEWASPFTLSLPVS